jgi:hypothetical protein
MDLQFVPYQADELRRDMQELAYRTNFIHKGRTRLDIQNRIETI